jgi:RNA exonuclease 1
VTVSADADLSSIANAWARQSFRPTRAPDWREVPFHRPTDAEKEKVFAIDCEMVLTDNGRELARIAVVDYWTDEIVYDELVKPRGEVLDYLTE